VSKQDGNVEDHLFRDLLESLGGEVLIVTQCPQLNLLGQNFRPVFCGTISEIEDGHITLYPVIIKMVNAQFYENPFPLSIPLEKIAHFTTNFDCGTRFPIS
jgi:hypothetical protein